jgi:hypothetical protein
MTSDIYFTFANTSPWGFEVDLSDVNFTFANTLVRASATDLGDIGFAPHL